MRNLLAPLALTVALAGSASAEVYLTFDNVPGDGGRIDYDGHGGALIGTNIEFSTITGVNTPMGAGDAVLIHGGLLNFETGGNLAERAASYEWAAGGYFTLVGTAYRETSGKAGFDLGDEIIADGTLIDGYFVANADGVGVSAFSTGVGADWTFSGGGFDVKHEGLLSYFGISSANFRFASTNITASFTPDANKGFSAAVKEADITNTSLPVPEPATMALLGLGAVSMTARRRRG